MIDAEGDEIHVTVDCPAAPCRSRSGQGGWATSSSTCSTPTWTKTPLHDRDIAHRLYGGDRTTRIEQEIILGVGGVRALGALGLKPTVWHINEGHAAFLILERMRS